MVRRGHAAGTVVELFPPDAPVLPQHRPELQVEKVLGDPGQQRRRKFHADSCRCRCPEPRQRTGHRPQRRRVAQYRQIPHVFECQTPEHGEIPLPEIRREKRLLHGNCQDLSDRGTLPRPRRINFPAPAAARSAAGVRNLQPKKRLSNYEKNKHLSVCRGGPAVRRL